MAGRPRTRTAVAAGLAALAGDAAAQAAMPEVAFLRALEIHDDDVGFDEPSGLALAPDGALWSVSDDTRALFRLDPETGRAERVAGLPRLPKGLEGVAVAGDRLIMAREDGNELVVLRPGDAGDARRVALDDLPGWDAVAEAFEGDDNKGIEGVAVEAATGAVHLVKEGRPRMLLTLSAALDRIVAHRRLDAEAGFAVDGLKNRRLDVSGLAHDPGRGALWIVSDRGARVFLFDQAAGRASSAPLTWLDDGDRRTVKKAEGVALDPARGRLFVVTDDGRDSLLLEYELR